MGLQLEGSRAAPGAPGAPGAPASSNVGGNPPSSYSRWKDTILLAASSGQSRWGDEEIGRVRSGKEVGNTSDGDEERKRRGQGKAGDGGRGDTDTIIAELDQGAIAKVKNADHGKLKGGSLLERVRVGARKN